MKEVFLKRVVCFWVNIGLLFLSRPAISQDTLASFKSSGHLYGLMFGDYYYKGHADSLGRGGNQYAGMPEQSNAFQFRRIYIGYRYQFSRKFTANLLLEGNQTINPQHNSQFNIYIKLANLEWKNILPRTNLVIGQINTPTFSVMASKTWGYRSVERTITDMHGSPSYDFGLALEGRLDKEGLFGYNLMVGNGSGKHIKINKYKKFYGEAYATLADKRLILELYGDYERLHGQRGFHYSQNMFKVLAAYTTTKLTFGVETFSNYLRNGMVREMGSLADTLSTQAFGISVFTRGVMVKDRLGFFARLDRFNPSSGLEGSLDYQYHNLNPAYDPGNKQLFVTAGIDFTPMKQVHFIPNIWYATYPGRPRLPRGYDLVYRLTFYFEYD